LDWVDRVLPAGAVVAIVPFPSNRSFFANADLWWDTEFWNRSVSQAYVAGNGDFRYTPFPTRTLAPVWRTGAVPGTEHAAQYALIARRDSRFGFAAQRIGTKSGVDAGPRRPAQPRRGACPTGRHPGRLRDGAACLRLVSLGVWLELELRRSEQPRGRDAERAAPPDARAGGDREVDHLRRYRVDSPPEPSVPVEVDHFVMLREERQLHRPGAAQGVHGGAVVDVPVPLQARRVSDDAQRALGAPQAEADRHAGHAGAGVRNAPARHPNRSSH